MGAGRLEMLAANRRRAGGRAGAAGRLEALAAGGRGLAGRRGRANAVGFKRVLRADCWRAGSLGTSLAQYVRYCPGPGRDHSATVRDSDCLGRSRARRSSSSRCAGPGGQWLWPKPGLNLSWNSKMKAALRLPASAFLENY